MKLIWIFEVPHPQARRMVGITDGHGRTQNQIYVFPHRR